MGNPIQGTLTFETSQPPTNSTIYYQTTSGTWKPVVIGSGLSFNSTGLLSTSGISISIGNTGSMAVQHHTNVDIRGGTISGTRIINTGTMYFIPPSGLSSMDMKFETHDTGAGDFGIMHVPHQNDFGPSPSIDHVLTIGYNLLRENTGEHSFSWNLENNYWTSEGVNQLEWYYAYQNSSGNLSYRPIAMNINLHENYNDIGLKGNDVIIGNKNDLDDWAHFRTPQNGDPPNLWMRSNSYLTFAENTNYGLIIGPVGQELIGSTGSLARIAASYTGINFASFIESVSDDITLIVGRPNANGAKLRWTGTSGSDRRWEFQRNDGKWIPFEQLPTNYHLYRLNQGTLASPTGSYLELGYVEETFGYPTIVQLDIMIGHLTDDSMTQRHVFMWDYLDEIGTSQWQEVLPLQASRPGSVALDVRRGTNGRKDLRLRRKKASLTNSTIHGVLTVEGSFDEFFHSISTGQGATASTFAGGNLPAIASLTGQNTIYYRESTDTWNPVIIGSGLNFSGGILTSSGVGEDLISLEATNQTGVIYYRSGNGRWSPVTIGSGLSFNSNNGVLISSGGSSGNFQPLDADLTSLANASQTNALYYRSGVDSWTPLLPIIDRNIYKSVIVSTGGDQLPSGYLISLGMYDITSQNFLSINNDILLKTDITGGVSSSYVLPIGNGGTNASNAISALSNLGGQPLDADLTSLANASQTGTLYFRSGSGQWSPVIVGSGLNFTSGVLRSSGGGASVTGVVPISLGGTNATTESQARTNLGLAIGTNVQAYDSDLQGIAVLNGFQGLIACQAEGLWFPVELQSPLSMDFGGTNGNARLAVAIADSSIDRSISIAVFTPATSISTASSAAEFYVPSTLNGYEMTSATAYVSTAGAGGGTDVTIVRTRGASSVTSISFTIAAGSKTDDGSISNDDLQTGDVLKINIDSVPGTPPKGLIVTINASAA